MMERDSQKITPKSEALLALEEAEKERAAKRFERGLLEFENDRLDILRNKEFTDKLASYIYGQFTRGDYTKAEQVLRLVFDAVLTDNRQVELLPVLDELCRDSMNGSNVRLMQSLTSGYNKLLQKKENRSIITQELSQFLSIAGGFFVRGGLWDAFDDLLDSVKVVRNITVSTDDGAESPFKDVIVKMASKDVIEKILLLYKTGSKQQKEMATRVFSQIGDEAVLYLLNRLVFSPTREERLILIQLISGLGSEIIRIIQKFMEEDLPWYAIRNLVLLVAEIGNPDFYPLIEGYLVHPDERVQQQVVSCIITMGGDKLPQRLIQALPVVNNGVKMKLVMQLGEYNDEALVNGLLDIIHKRKELTSDIHDDLLFRTCVTLRSYPYASVIKILKEYQKTLASEKKTSRKILIAVEETINLLEPKIRHRKKGQKSDLEKIGFDEDSNIAPVTMENFDEFLAEIETLLQNGEVDSASSLIYKKSVDAARSKNFEVAEMLRDKLLETNPEALQDVIRVAELIEEEKDSTTVETKVDLWDDLFSKLTNEEYRYLMSVFTNESYQKDETIVTAGQIDPCLYFFSEGTGRMSFSSGKNETFLKRIKPGDVIGINQFFSASVWTINITALQRSQVQVISRSSFAEKSKKFPKLEEKLFDFLKGRENVEDLVKMSGRDRRDSARYPVNVTVNNILLDQYGSSQGRRSFQGEMLDISKGGLSFTIRISSRESANLLLGRQLISEIHLKGSNTLKCFGLIVGVRSKHEIVKEYSVHVKFYRDLAQKKVTEVLNLVI